MNRHSDKGVQSAEPDDPIQQPQLPPRRSIEWDDGRIRFIDQRCLPGKLKVVETDDWFTIDVAIRRLGLRGAPLIGVAAALAVAVAAVKYRDGDVRREVLRAIDGLYAARPTAVNLFRALDKMREICAETPDEGDLTDALVTGALEILEDDRRRCAGIGKHGLVLLRENARVLTICNTGFLATAGNGTALGIIYRAHDAGRNVHVHVCETRPLLQGARLTAWELKNAGIPFTLIVDSAAAGLAAAGKIDICIIGADRIAANGDTANKIGSFQLALVCREHGIPFYVAAPESTIDRACPDGSRIPIEERPGEEITYFQGKQVAPDDTPVWNPAFDMVPAELITGIITENGIQLPPFKP